MKQEVLSGQTDYTVLILIRDDAGAPKTGLTEASVDIAYARVETDNDVTTADVTPASLSALTDAHTDWGFEEVSSTDHPGLYRLDIADAVFASGAWSAVVSIVGTGLDPTSIEFVLIAFNPRDGVRLGLTALPNAAADAAGGLPISDAGGLDLDAQIGTDIDSILVDTAEIGAAGAGLTAVPWNAAWDAEVQSEVADALAVYDPPTKAELDAAVANVSVDEIQATALADLFNTDSGTTYASAVAGSVVAEIADNAGGASLSVQDIVDGVWDEAQASHVTAGSFGEIATEIAAVLVDTGTTLQAELDGIQADTEDLQSRIPAALTADGNMKADALRIRGSATAADNLEEGAEALVPGTCAAGSSTTSIVTNLTEATDDHYNGRIITFVTGALVGQSTDITDYDGSTKTLTVTALTEAPADTNAFVIS